MTPKNPFDLLLPSAALDKLVRSSKSAKKAMAKARRKLKFTREDTTNENDA